MKKKRKIPVSKIFVYFILAGIGFVYLYPVLYMIVNSFLSAGDLTDPSVTWIPTELCFDNFSTAFETLDFFKSFGMSMLMSLIPAVLQTAVTAVVAYGLARFHIPFKKVILVLILIVMDWNCGNLIKMFHCYIVPEAIRCFMLLIIRLSATWDIQIRIKEYGSFGKQNLIYIFGQEL